MILKDLFYFLQNVFSTFAENVHRQVNVQVIKITPGKHRRNKNTNNMGNKDIKLETLSTFCFFRFMLTVKNKIYLDT